MKAPEDKQGLFKSARDHLVRGFCLAYRIFILPRSENEDRKRRERIFNTIATTMIGIVCLLELFVAYAEFTRTSYTGFHITTFSFFIIFFGGLLALSRKGHTDLASYLFIGVYFLGATYGIYAWGIELPLSILSYAVIIVISSTLVGTWFGLVMACVISITFISIGYLETTGKIVSNLAWRSGPLEWKDSFEGSFFYFSVFAVSWLSNKDLEKSLKRARLSEEALKKERDLLEAKV